jgi:hypothetical protein
MGNIFTPPLSVTEFATFKQFLLRTAPQGLGCGDVRLWTLADAARAAVSIEHALGHPGIFAETAEQQEERALAEMLSEFNTPNWRMDMEALVRMPIRDDAVTFALDVEGRGLDEGALVPSRDLVKRLNTWCETALDAFYQRCGGPVEDEATPAPADPAESERIDPPTTGEPAPRPEDERNDAARSQANPEENPTTAPTPAKLVANYLASASEPSERGLKRYRQKLGLSYDPAYTWKILMQHVPVGTFNSIGGRGHKG